jgi:hypothetical protein
MLKPNAFDTDIDNGNIELTFKISFLGEVYDVS